MFKADRARRIKRGLSAVAMALIVAGGPAAGSASAAELDSFSGMGTGFALGVTVDLSGLPSAAKSAIQTAYAPIAQASDGQLPAQFPFVIDQRFIETLSEMGDNQIASALLGTGFVDFDDQKVEVTETGTASSKPPSVKIPSSDLPILDVSVGDLVASIAAGPNVSSNGTLARVTAGLDALDAVLPAELKAAFDEVTDAVNDVIATGNTTLDSTLGDVADELVDTTDPVLGGILAEAGLEDVADDVTALTDELQTTLNIPTLSDILDGDLASVTAMKSVTQTEKLKSGKVVSDASSSIAAVNALGLVKTGLIKIESHSEAAGVKGSAKNTSSCSIADVSVGGANGVSLDGENLYVNGTAVPVPATSIGAIKDVVDQVLAQAGLKVDLCDVAQADADVDGTSAAQRVSAFRIEFAPRAVADVAPLGIAAGDELVSIVIDPTVETQVGAVLSAPTTVDPKLPATGAAPIATVLVGLGLAGAAFVARKRLTN